jgi:hypothetical protein
MKTFEELHNVCPNWLYWLTRARKNIQTAVNRKDVSIRRCPQCNDIVGWKRWDFVHDECTPIAQLSGGYRFHTHIPDGYLVDIADCVPGTLWAEMEESA